MDSTFTITAPPNTDIWRKPPSTDAFTAPHKLQAPIPLSSFRSARISFRGPWTHQYDQAGLLLLITSPSQSTPRWLKTGIEYYKDAAMISTVGCDTWADWSVYPKSEAEPGGARGWTTVEVERRVDELGISLWVYYIERANGGVVRSHSLREVNWVFAGEGEGVTVQIGAYAARPASGGEVGEKGLEVEFRDFKVVC